MGYYRTVAIIIGGNIRNKRRDFGMTQSQLGRRLNLGQKAISDIELGKYAPNSAYLKELAKIFNCTTDDFYA